MRHINSPSSTLFTFFLSSLLLLLAFTPLQGVAKESNKELEPTLSFVGSGPVLPIHGSLSLPINTLNVDSVDLELLAINKPEQFVRNHYRSHLNRYDLTRLKRDYQSSHFERFEIAHQEPNKAVMSRLSLPSKLKSGWYIAVLKQSGTFDSVEVRHLLLTDLGAHARLYQNHLAVDVTRYSTGRHVSSGLVKLFGKDGLKAQAYLDRQGKTQINEKPSQSDLLLIESEQETTLLPFSEVPLDLSAMPVSGRQYQSQEAFIYSNRELIKPGETLPVHILLRDADGELLPEQPIHLRLITPKRNVAQSLQLSSSASGYYHKEFIIAADATIGRWSLEVRTDPSAKTPIQVFHFQVEEFIPERMNLTFSAQQTLFSQYDEPHLQLTGNYLFGAPANGHQIKSSVVYHSMQHLSGPYQDYYVGTPFRIRNSFQEQGKVELDSLGQAELQLPIPQQKLQSPVQASLNLQLLESGGAAVQRSFSYQISQGQQMAALKPIDAPFLYYSSAQFDVRTLGANGQQPLAGEVMVEAYYDRGRYYWVYEEGAGWQQKSQDRWEMVYKQKILTTPQRANRIAFPILWGKYRVVATELKSGLKTTYDFYSSWLDSSVNATPVKPEHLELSLDQENYKNGEQALLSLNAPTAGEAVITIESDQELYYERRVLTKGSHELPLTIKPEWKRHDLYLSVLLTANKAGQPVRYLGVKPLKLNRDERKLKVEIELPEKAEPLTELTIPVSVANAASQEVWVTLSVVDMGIINLSRYQPQNPADYFFTQRRYAVDRIDLFSRLYEQRPDPFAISRFGGDGIRSLNEQSAQLVESKTVQLMSQAVRLDATGKGEIQLSLPDYNGSAQVVATAFTPNAFGQAIQELTIAAPVLAELSIPKFMAPGDTSTVTLELHNQSGTEKNFDITLTASDQINFIKQEAMPFTLKLNNKERYTAAFPIQISSNSSNGMAQFKLVVAEQGNDSAMTLKREWESPIRHSSPIQANRKTVLLKPGESWQAEDQLWDGLTPIPGKESRVGISLLPQINLDDHARQLFRYPYGCAEQTISKAMPFLLEAEQLAPYQQKALKERDAKAFLTVAISRLTGMQRHTGGFGLWSYNSPESPWLTAYVFDFLIQANNKHPGIVPEELLEKTAKRLKSYVTNHKLLKENSRGVENQLASFAYASHLLAKQGKLTWGEISKFDGKPTERIRWPSQLSQGHIVSAFYRVGAAEQGETLLESLLIGKRSKGYFYDYGSQIRDKAALFALLQELEQDKLTSGNLNQVLLYLLSVELNDEIATQSWFSTQENYHLVRASLIQQQLNQGSTLTFQLNGTTHSAQNSFSQMTGKSVELTNSGDKPLYLNFLTYGHVNTISSSASTISFKSMQRRYWRPDGKYYSGNTPFNVGERIVAELLIELSENVPDALVVEQIPAGMELENPNLNKGLNLDDIELKFTSSSRSIGVLKSDSEYEAYRNDRYVISRSLKKDKLYRFYYLLRAEAPGKYQIPPLYLESMYRPERRILLAPNAANIEIKGE